MPHAVAIYGLTKDAETLAKAGRIQAGFLPQASAAVWTAAATQKCNEVYGMIMKARDCVALMKHLGFEQFAIVGHDRGSYTAFRTAMDHPLGGHPSHRY